MAERLKIDVIIDTVCIEMNVARKDLYRKSRYQDIVDTRYLVYYFALQRDVERVVSRLSLIFKQGHPNILHGLKSISNMIETNDPIVDKINIINSKLNYHERTIKTRSRAVLDNKVVRARMYIPAHQIKKVLGQVGANGTANRAGIRNQTLTAVLYNKGQQGENRPVRWA